MLLEQWTPLWQSARKESAPPQARAWQGPALPPLVFERFIEVLSLYKEGAGLGIDDFNPRSWLLLPKDFLERFLDILHAWEANPHMPP